jgi:hypothetical protein
VAGVRLVTLMSRGEGAQVPAAAPSRIFPEG